MYVMVPLAILVCLAAQSSGQTQMEGLRPLRFDSPNLLNSPKVPSPPIQVDANAFSPVRPTVAVDVPAGHPFPTRQPAVETSPLKELHRPIQLKPIELGSLETASVFDAENSQPVVMVWLNSGLEDQLLSQTQLQQLLGRIPIRDQTTAPASDEDRNVRVVSFLQEDEPESADKESKDDSESPVKGFQKRIDALEKRYETRKAQIADDKTLDDATIGDLNSQLAHYQEEQQKFVGFGAKLEALQAEQKKESARKPATPDPEYLKLSLQRLEDVNDLTDLVLSDLTEKTDLDRRDARTKTDELKSEIETLSVECDKAIETMSAKVQTKTALIQTKRDQLRGVRERIAVRDARVTELPRVSNKVGNDLADVKDQIEELRELPDDNNKSARKLVLESKELALELEEESIRLEAQRQDQTGRLYPLEVSILTTEIKRLEPELKTFREVLGALRDAEIQVREKLDEVELNDEVTAKFSVLTNLAEMNKKFTEDRSDLINRLEECHVQLVKVEKQNEETRSGFEGIKGEIDDFGKAASGIRLIEHQRTLLSTGESQMRRMQFYNDLQSSKLEALQLKELRDQLNNREDYMANLTTKLDAEMAADKKFQGLPDQDQDRTRSRAIEIAGRLVATQEDYVNELIKDYGNHEKDLSKLDVQHKQLIQNVQIAREFIEQHALWVRSATPVGLKDVAPSRKGMAEFFNGERWQSLVDQVGQRMTDRPYDVAILVLFIGTMCVVQRRLRWSHD